MAAPVAGALMLPQLRMDPATIESRVRAAEEAGLHSVWFMDHLAAPARPDADALEGWTLASFLAARTERIRLGHLVLCDAFRPPALLAKMAATLDVLSNGRLELGLGWGSVPGELATFGIGREPPAVRAARLDETLTAVRALLTGEPVDLDGEHVTLRGAIARPRPVQDPLPITIGGAGRRLTVPLVNAHADWWNCPCYAVDRLAELRPLVADHVRVSVQRPLGMASSSAEREEVAALADRRFGSWGGLVTGTPDEVAAALQRDVDLGAELTIAVLHDFGRPESIRLFADEVVPALRHPAAESADRGRTG